MFWNKSKKEEKDGFAIQTLHFKGHEYIKVDDLIGWLRANQPLCEEKISVHWLIKTFVKMKNTKVTKTKL